MLSPSQLTALAQSKEFQELLKQDPHLAELSRIPANLPEELEILLDINQSPDSIGTCRVFSVTPLLWSILWTIENHYVSDLAHVTEQDTEIFLYLLTLPQINLRGDARTLLPVKAAGICYSAGLSWHEASAALLIRVQRSFAPLKMLPAVKNKTVPAFDSDWLISLCSIAARESGTSITDVMKMPLSLCFNLLIQYKSEFSIFF